jgi:hypothetical protein
MSVFSSCRIDARLTIIGVQNLAGLFFMFATIPGRNATSSTLFSSTYGDKPSYTEQIDTN